MTLLAPTLQAFFTDRLIRQRNASPQTVAAYRDALRLLIVYAAQQRHRQPSTLDLDDLDAGLISGFLDHLQRVRHNGVRTRNARLAAIHSLAGALPDTPLRAAMTRYVQARAAVLAASSVDGLIDALIPFGDYLAHHHPHVTSLRHLDRGHVEGFLAWNRTRPWRGRKARPQPVSPSAAHAAVLGVRNLLDDVTLWGWAERPPRQLLFASDLPRLPRPLPRALPPDHDSALMAAVTELDDPFARSALLVLRYAGLRLGELLDLELDAVVDFGNAGTWLRVPLGKLKTERDVPLDDVTIAIAALDDCAAHRGPHRALPHPDHGRPTDFLFVDRGRRVSAWRIRRALAEAVAAAGLRGHDGQLLPVAPHQLRHTYATRLANAGMSLQALMALLGHVTPEMTLRYATLASPTIRAAYDDAMAKVRRRLPILGAAPTAAPAKVEWLRSEFLKTRVAHGYCSRHLAAEACPYANICEQCDNFVPAPEHADVLAAQLNDVRQLRDDADARGWTSEHQRHSRVADKLEQHLATLARVPLPAPGA